MKGLKNHGVTLVEMLVAIGILALLATLIIPTISSSVESANLAKCTSHLRELWVAQNHYSQDNDGRFLRYTDQEGLTWTARLQHDGYLAGPSKALSCPSFSKKTGNRTPFEVATISGGLGWKGWGVYTHYGYNHLHLGASFRNPESDSDPALRSPARLSQIRKPAQTIVFVDTIHTPSKTGNVIGSFITNDHNAGQHIPDPRHNGAVNMVFVDGHVESLKLKDPSNAFLPYPDGLGKVKDADSLWDR